MKPTHPDIALSLLTAVRDIFLHGRPEGSVYKESIHFICWELHRACGDMLRQGFPHEEALGQTTRELEGYVTAGLVDQHGRPWAGLCGWVRGSCPTAPLLMDMGDQLRLAWIDRMLHELKTKGTLP